MFYLEIVDSEASALCGEVRDELEEHDVGSFLVLEEHHSWLEINKKSQKKYKYVPSIELKTLSRFEFFHKFDAVLNGFSYPTLEDGFKARIFLLFPFCTCAVFVWAKCGQKLRVLHWHNDICCATLTPSAFLCMLVK